MTTVNIHAAKTNLSRLLEEAAAGTEIIIAKAGETGAADGQLEAQAHPGPAGRTSGDPARLRRAPARRNPC